MSNPLIPTLNNDRDWRVLDDTNGCTLAIRLTSNDEPEWRRTGPRADIRNYMFAHNIAAQLHGLPPAEWDHSHIELFSGSIIIGNWEGVSFLERRLTKGWYGWRAEVKQYQHFLLTLYPLMVITDIGFRNLYYLTHQRLTATVDFKTALIGQAAHNYFPTRSQYAAYITQELLKDWNQAWFPEHGAEIDLVQERLEAQGFPQVTTPKHPRVKL